MKLVSKNGKYSGHVQNDGNFVVSRLADGTVIGRTGADLDPLPEPPPTPKPPTPKPPNRTPDPLPGEQLPLPRELDIVLDAASEYPAMLKNSCQKDGGTWEFMELVVDRLRKIDTRWGFNCKRGDCSDISQDVVAYHYSIGPDEGSIDVYLIDIIGGHCGPNPRPQWYRLTGDDIGRWTYPRR